MTKPILPTPTGTVQIELKAYEQWQQLVTLLTNAQQTATGNQVNFDVVKLEAALTYGLQLTSPELSAKITTDKGVSKQKTPQAEIKWQPDQVYRYILWPRVEGGADLILQDGKPETKYGQLTEVELRRLDLQGGDVVTAVIENMKQVHEIQLVDHVTLETGLITLDQGIVEAGDITGLPGHLVVTHNATTVLTDDSGMPYPYVIPKPIVMQKQIKEGDHVDLRWYQGELMTICLIWRYSR